MILGAKEKDFVYGHLFTQGVIRQAGEVKLLTIKRNRADVTLTKTIKQSPVRKIPAGFTVKRQDIFRCVESVLKSDIFAETEAVHSAGLFLEAKESIALAEDIGRHNALDKVIGRGLLQGVDFSRCIIASTGRMASDMVMKICRAGVPVVATKAAVTATGLAVGKKYGLTMAAFVRNTGMKLNTDMDERVIKKAEMRIYSGAERVV
jgi:FdhD protein